MKFDKMNQEKCELDSILAINLDYNKFIHFWDPEKEKCLLFVDIFLCLILQSTYKNGNDQHQVFDKTHSFCELKKRKTILFSGPPNDERAYVAIIRHCT